MKAFKFSFLVLILFFISFQNYTLESQVMIYESFTGGWESASNEVVTWDTAYFDGNVDIYLWNMESNSFTTMTTDFPSDSGYFVWYVPATTPTSDFYRVKIASSDNEYEYIFTYGYFSIDQSAPMISSHETNMIQKNLISLYPNPSNGLININATFTFNQIQIFDEQGKLLKYYNNLNLDHFELNNSDLTNGVYFVKIIEKNGTTWNKKFIIEK